MDFDDTSTFSSTPQGRSVGYTFSSSSSSSASIKPSLTPKQKERVDSADAPLNQRRCLVQNYFSDPSLEYCHLVARQHTKNEDLVSLVFLAFRSRRTDPIFTDGVVGVVLEYAL
jgi:hypothetical protein